MSNKSLIYDFIKTVQRDPDKIALVHNEEKITYYDLLSKAYSISLLLQSKGVQTGDRVVVLLKKSIDAVAAILGILLAKAAYIPLDIRWPVERQKKIILDCSPKAVISFEAINTLDVSEIGAIIINTNEMGKIGITPWRAYETGPYKGIGKNSLALILYTSGSTGIPKGVCISHQAVIFFRDWAKKKFRVSPKDSIAAVSPFTFDLSTFDLFAGLVAAATVHLIDDFIKAIPAKLGQYLETNKITIIYAVPTLLMYLENRGKLAERKLTSLRLVLFAGEVYPTSAFQRLKDLLSKKIKYFNLYGPTETNVCTYYQVPNHFDTNKPFPIGKPLPGVKLFTIKAEDDDILCVVSPACMEGYWNTSADSREIWAHSARYQHQKAFITYDCVKRLSDGNWLFFGRKDDLVKVRGYRISLKEIESEIIKVPEVANAAVVAVKDAAINQRMIAYVIRKRSIGATNSDVKAEILSCCRHNLPTFMAPDDIVILNEMPVTSSGKIDKLKLISWFNNR